ncbi:hypothetical protein JJJA_0045 [Achromobacter phage JWDelta]|uniref:Uncharacterized protein n=2 Tax=Jwalphavirus jwalpha TaxID=2169963 RepID=V9VG17_9CAUD|nr:hypothetical protein CH29_gp48 [Achromobacter phage JWAlpha]AHC56561.1 hypothetical protein JJJA_0045 [Achromobacter phage JWDelta]AHC94001.1 hypothetical protein JJJB_0048 [Achromobacter phage JWAlpha]
MRTPFFRPRPKKPVRLPIMFRGSTDMENELKIVPFVYLDNISRGTGDVEMFLTLVFRVLSGLKMCEYFPDQSKQLARVVLPSLAALWSVGNRIIKKHKVGFSGDEYKAIQAGLVQIDNMHGHVTRKEHRDIISDVGMKVGGMSLTMQSLEPYKDHV